jgi:hypothetical protein
VLRFPHGWAEAQPRAIYLFSEEVRFWNQGAVLRLRLRA